MNGFAWHQLPVLKTLKLLWFSEVGVFTFHFPNLVIIRKKKRFLKFSPLEIAAERGRKCKIFSMLDLQSGSSGLSPALGPCWITSWLASARLVFTSNWVRVVIIRVELCRLRSSENWVVGVASRSGRINPVTNVDCDWFILPLLLPTPTIWFSIDHKWKSHKWSQKKMETS